METKRVLIVGADPGSLGGHILEKFRIRYSGKNRMVFGSTVSPDKVSPGGLLWLDIRDPDAIADTLEAYRPTDIICCAGANFNEAGLDNVGIHDVLRVETMDLNFHGPMRLLEAWLATDEVWSDGVNQFVVISSNSAHIARSSSPTYCASKAALSMAVRCHARALAGKGFAIYGYEPGWMDGTPMSDRVTKWLDDKGITQAHRIPGGQGVDPAALSSLILNNFIEVNQSLNGCLLRIDGGEQ